MSNEVAPKQLRSFGLIVGGIFVVLGLWPTILRGEPLRLWAVGLAILLLLPALIRPTSLRLPYRGWMTLGEALGWVNTRIILGAIFYGLFTPTGQFLRLKRTDPMRRQWEPGAETYRQTREPRPSSHMTHQF
jgi:hypothetical protein